MRTSSAKGPAKTSTKSHRHTSGAEPGKRPKLTATATALTDSRPASTRTKKVSTFVGVGW